MRMCVCVCMCVEANVSHGCLFLCFCPRRSMCPPCSKAPDVCYRPPSPLCQPTTPSVRAHVHTLITGGVSMHMHLQLTADDQDCLYVLDSPRWTLRQWPWWKTNEMGWNSGTAQSLFRSSLGWFFAKSHENTLS